MMLNFCEKVFNHPRFVLDFAKKMVKQCSVLLKHVQNAWKYSIYGKNSLLKVNICYDHLNFSTRPELLGSFLVMSC